MDYEIVDLNKVAKHTVTMPKDFFEGDNQVSAKFIEYALPLVGQLPEIGRLRDISIVKGKTR